MSTIRNRSQVVIASGFKMFHLHFAAEEAARRGRMAAMITGLYPKGIWDAAGRLAARRGIAQAKRFLSRGVRLPDERVDTSLPDEALHATGVACASRGLHRFSDGLDDWAARRFAARLGQRLARHRREAGILHVRSGFGGDALARARALGYRVICDHSIVHPTILRQLMAGGQGPQAGGAHFASVWRRVEADLAQADVVLVNSDFVKESFAMADAPTDNVVVRYLGVDEVFLQHLSELSATPVHGPTRFLFAGTLERRKGIDALAVAIEILSRATNNWELTLAGPAGADPDRALARMADHDRVCYLGIQSRADLARLMAGADVFVFPSLAEGSARVVFEALAAGCFAIVTPQSGSVVENGINGMLTSPNDPRALAAAMLGAIDRIDRIRDERSIRASLIGRAYSQHAYGEALTALYDDVLAGAEGLPTGV